MSAPSSPLAGATPHDLLRRLGAEVNRAVATRPIVPSGAPFRFVPLGIYRGWPVTLCEARIGIPAPPWEVRRAWRQRLRGDLRRGIVVFTDGAHSGFVWSWYAPAGATVGLCIEHRVPGRDATLEAALRALPLLGVSSTAAPPVAAEIRAEFRRRLASHLRGSGSPTAAVDPASVVGDLADPVVLRRIWRIVRSFTVLDARCRNADRLLGAAWELERMYGAVLERMRVFLDDAAAERNRRRRPEHLRDFRALVDLAENPDTGSDRGRFIRRCIVQQNLYGLATSPAAATSTVRDLLGYCEIPDPRDAILDCNVVRTRPISAPASRARSAGAGQITTRPETADGIQALCAVAAAVRRQRLSCRGRPHEIRAATRQLHARRRVLLRELLASTPVPADEPERQLFTIEPRLLFVRELPRDDFSFRFDE